MDRAELLAGTVGDLCILALGIDADDGTFGGEQIWYDGSHTLAGCGRRHGEQMAVPVIAQRFPDSGHGRSEGQSRRGRGGRLPCQWQSAPIIARDSTAMKVVKAMLKAAQAQVPS
ncbi:hypothetical protein [Sinorhizobium meliloti]|uniref:hypothetical protein n=1 Tax=Rhizobium meliloti TaxID=382 RepID=UPI00246892DF|nr:hypothetical protein [Sinorhizobium meliloti]